MNCIINPRLLNRQMKVYNQGGRRKNLNVAIHGALINNNIAHRNRRKRILGMMKVTMTIMKMKKYKMRKRREIKNYSIISLCNLNSRNPP